MYTVSLLSKFNSELQKKKKKKKKRKKRKKKKKETEKKKKKKLPAPRENYPTGFQDPGPDRPLN